MNISTLSKIELIILGGTWSSYPESYQIWFVKRCFDALNDFEKHNSSIMIKDEDMSLPFEESKLEEINGEKISKTYNQIISNAIKNTQNILKENAPIFWVVLSLLMAIAVAVSFRLAFSPIKIKKII